MMTFRSVSRTAVPVLSAFSLLAMSACSKKDETPAGGGSGTYKVQNLPPNFKVELPDSVKGKSSSGGGVVVHGRPGLSLSGSDPVLRRKAAARELRLLTATATSYGYQQIADAVTHIADRAKQLDPYFVFIDAGFADIKTACAGVSPCSLAAGAVSITITQAMVDKMKEELASYHEDEASMSTEENTVYAAEKANLDALVGTEEDLPALTYTDVSADDSGYDHKIEFPYDDSASGYGKGTITIAWSTDGKKINFASSYDDTGATDLVGGGGKGEDSFSYDDTTKVMTVRYAFEFSGITYETAMTVQEDASSAKNGVIMSSVMQGSGMGVNYTEKVKGYADDEGGYLETIYSYSVATVEATATTALADGEYFIVPSTVSKGDVSWSTAVGSISASSGSYSVAYWGPIASSGAISGFKVFAATYDESYAITVGEEVTGVTLSSGAKTSFDFYYREAFDGEGNLTAIGYKDSATGDYLTISGNFDDTTYDTTYETESASEDSITSFTASISGATGTDDLVVVRDGVTPAGSDWSQVAIGYASYDGSSFVLNYWGTEDEAATADVYALSYDYSLEVPEVFTALTGATLATD